MFRDRNGVGPQLRRIYESEKWSGDRFKKLVILYGKYPCLWKKDDPCYLDSKSRHKAYTKIHHGMSIPNLTFVDVMTWIRKMRQLYVKELNKFMRNEFFETEFSWFYDLHEFLYPYLDYDETIELRKLALTSREENECSQDSESDFSINCNNSSGNDDRNMPSTSSLISSSPKPQFKKLKRETHKNRFNPRGIASSTFILTEASSKAQDDTIPEIKTKSCDQYESFAQSIICQLRKMNSDSALRAQMEIQRILTDIALEKQHRVSENSNFTEPSLVKKVITRRVTVSDNKSMFGPPNRTGKSRKVQVNPSPAFADGSETSKISEPSDTGRSEKSEEEHARPSRLRLSNQLMYPLSARNERRRN